MSVDFLDSNVFVYLFDETDDRKRTRAEELVREGIVSGEGCISYQVVQETLAVVTRKLKRKASIDQARELFDYFLAPLWRVMPTPELYLRGLELQQRYSIGFYDALIVGAALEGGCTRLWSEDLQDGLTIGRLKIQDPFREPSPSRRAR